MTFREDPPPDPEEEPTPWIARLAGAAADPGHWYRIEDEPGKVGWNHKMPGALKAADRGLRAYPLLPSGRWEFKHKPVPGHPGRVHIWARNIPD